MLLKNLVYWVTPILFCTLAGCAQEQSAAAKELESRSRALQPRDAAVLEIYQRSCRNCHTIAATGAPLTGDFEAWSVRMEKGMDTLIDNVVGGIGGMPPFGMCMDCEVREFEALIVFMAEAPDPMRSEND